MCKNANRRRLATLSFSALVCLGVCHLFLKDLLLNILKGLRLSIEWDLLQWIFQPTGILWSNGLLSNFSALSSIVPPHYTQKWFFSPMKLYLKNCLHCALWKQGGICMCVFCLFENLDICTPWPPIGGQLFIQAWKEQPPWDLEAWQPEGSIGTTVVSLSTSLLHPILTFS